jgi:hypothetical protein
MVLRGWRFGSGYFGRDGVQIHSGPLAEGVDYDLGYLESSTALRSLVPVCPQANLRALSIAS